MKYPYDDDSMVSDDWIFQDIKSLILKDLKFKNMDKSFDRFVSITRVNPYQFEAIILLDRKIYWSEISEDNTVDHTMFTVVRYQLDLMNQRVVRMSKIRGRSIKKIISQSLRGNKFNINKASYQLILIDGCLVLAKTFDFEDLSLERYFD